MQAVFICFIHQFDFIKSIAAAFILKIPLQKSVFNIRGVCLRLGVITRLAVLLHLYEKCTTLRMSPSVRKLFKVVLYVGLWTVGLFVFVRNQVDEFLMHKTNYLVSNEPISLHDLPDLAICFKYGPKSRNPRKRLIYGRDFSILFKVFERDSQVWLQT